ncbi:MAG: caspase family protein [Candidatus Helarchaeota archaeon]
MKKALLAILVVTILLIPGLNAVDNNQTIEKKDGFVKMGYEWDGTERVLNPFNGRQPILQFIFSSLLINFKDNFISNVRNTPSEVMTGGIDQSQEDYSGGYVEIYGDKTAAQSFATETYGLLTSINIYVVRDFKLVYSTAHGDSKIIRAKNEPFTRNGDLIVTIKDGLDGSTLMSRRLTPEDIPLRSQRWISISFYSPVEVELNKEYFIEVSQTGGDEKHFYKWYYGNGNCYPNGEAYIKDSGGWESFENDFAFETYGDYTGDEPDGIVDRWAVVVGSRDGPGDDINIKNDAIDVNNLLTSNSWKTNLLIDSNKDEIKQAITTMKEKEDEDDIVLFFFSGHGVIFDYDGDGTGDESLICPWGNEAIRAKELNEMFNGYASQKIIFIFESCHSGGFISGETYNLVKNGRAILTSSKADELSWSSHSLHNSYLPYYLVESLQIKSLDDDMPGELGNREISLEEAYPYIYEKVTKKRPDQHPQFWTGIDEEVGITFY